MAEHTDDPAGINPPNGQRHGLFRALPPLSIPRALRRTQTCSAQIAGGMPVSDAGTARDVRDQCNDPIRSTNKSVNTTHTTLRSPGADELLARPGILPDATPPEASLVRRPMTDTSTRHDGAKFGMDEAAAASVKSAVLSRPNADDAMATNPFTAIPKVQSVPESHPPTPVLRFNEEDGTIRKIKNIGNKLAAPFAPSGNTASLSPPPVTQGAKLKSPEGKSKNSAKDADAQHWSRLSRKERVSPFSSCVSNCRSQFSGDIAQSSRFRHVCLQLDLSASCTDAKAVSCTIRLSETCRSNEDGLRVHGSTAEVDATEAVNDVLFILASLFPVGAGPISARN